MKKITVLLPLFFVFHVHGQEKMMDYCGLVIFEASIPFFKEIKARNEKVICVFYN